MTIGVDDITRIAYEATRLGLENGVIPWERLNEGAKDLHRDEIRAYLDDSLLDEVYEGDRVKHAIALELRSYM